MENKNIYQKLMEVRTKFHGLELKKSGHNKFAGFKYFELGDFLVPATKIMEEVGICPMVTFTDTLATMTVINTSNPSEVITFTSPMRELSLKGANEMQSLGGVETYQSRYLYIQLLNIVESDSFDAVSGSDANKNTNASALSDGQVKRLWAIASSNGIAREDVLAGMVKYYTKSEVKDLTKAEYDDLCAKLEKKAK